MPFKNNLLKLLIKKIAADDISGSRALSDTLSAERGVKTLRSAWKIQLIFYFTLLHSDRLKLSAVLVSAKFSTEARASK